MKKLLYVAISIVLFAAFTGCEDKRSNFYGDSEPKTNTTAANDNLVDITKDYNLSIPDYSKYYKLGQHSGLKYYINDANYEVNDQTIDSLMLSELGAEPQAVDRAAEENDYVNASIVGTVDGKEFDGSSVKNADIIIGRHTVMAEIENAIIGMKQSEIKSINYTFPRDYADANLVGKTAEFKITVNSVKAYNLDILTDEFVAEKTDYSTVAEYRKDVYDEIENSLADQKQTDSASILMSLILQNSEVSGYDTVQVDDMIGSAKYAVQTYAERDGLSLDEYCQKMYSRTYDEYAEGLTETAHEYLDTIMTICQIAHEENIEVTDEEYQEQVARYMEKYGFTNEGLSEAYTSNDIIYSVLVLKVQEWLLEHNTKSDTPIDYETATAS